MVERNNIGDSGVKRGPEHGSEGSKLLSRETGVGLNEGSNFSLSDRKDAVVALEAANKAFNPQEFAKNNSVEDIRAALEASTRALEAHQQYMASLSIRKTGSEDKVNASRHLQSGNGHDLEIVQT